LIKRLNQRFNFYPLFGVPESGASVAPKAENLKRTLLKNAPTTVPVQVSRTPRADV
jgi:hypothetical protein